MKRLLVKNLALREPCELIALKFIEFYQIYLSFDRGVLIFFAPGGACKYDMSCSEYAKRKIREFGAFRGSWLGIKRIWSCR